MSECKHGYYCKDGTPCALCHEDELAALRAKLQEAVGIAQKFAGVARDVCIAGLAQSAKLRQAEVRIAELEAERDRLRQERLDYSSVTTTEGLNASEWVWRTGKAEREAKAATRTATEAALRWAWNFPAVPSVMRKHEFVQGGLKALLGEDGDA